MESLSAAIHHRHHPNPLPLSVSVSTSRPPPLALKPPSILRFAAHKPYTIRTANLAIKAYLSPSSSQTPPLHHRKTLPEALLSVLKPACAALTAAAALLAFRLHSPSSFLAHAAAAPRPSLSESVPQTTASNEQNERILGNRLASDPDDVASLQTLMEVKLKAGQVPDAIEIVERLIRLHPDDRDFYLLKAQLHNHAGDEDAARRAFEEVLRKEPLAVEAYHGLVIIATQAEDFAGDAELEGIMDRIGVAMEACRKENRKAELRDFKLLVAQVRVMEGEYDEALDVYKELVSEEPKDFRPYLCQGIVYTLLRNKDEADRHFEKYRRLVPKEHPYAQYIEENMAIMKAFGPNQGRMVGALKR